MGRGAGGPRRVPVPGSQRIRFLTRGLWSMDSTCRHAMRKASTNFQVNGAKSPRHSTARGPRPPGIRAHRQRGDSGRREQSSANSTSASVFRGVGQSGVQAPGDSDDGVRAPQTKRARRAGISALGHVQAESQQTGTGLPPPAARGRGQASTPGPGGVGGSRRGPRGQGAHVLSWHVSRFRAGSSRLPRASVCHEFQPQTFPRQPQRKHPRPGALPGPPCACWLPSRRLGGRGASRGLPALFGFPHPALEPQTPVSPWRRPYPGTGTKTLQWGWGARRAGAMCSLHARTPQHMRPGCVCPQSRGAAGPRSTAGAALVPEVFAASSRSPSLGRTRRKSRAPYRGTRPQSRA